MKVAVCSSALTLAIAACGLGAAAPAGAESHTCMWWAPCPGPAAGGSPWQAVLSPNGGSWYSHPGLWAIQNHRGSFTLFWWNFFARYSRAQCISLEEPVSETGEGSGSGQGSGTVSETGGSTGWGQGSVTVNEGGEGNGPVLCEVVAE